MPRERTPKQVEADVAAYVASLPNGTPASPTDYARKHNIDPSAGERQLKRHAPGVPRTPRGIFAKRQAARVARQVEPFLEDHRRLSDISRDAGASQMAVSRAQRARGRSPRRTGIRTLAGINREIDEAAQRHAREAAAQRAAASVDGVTKYQDERRIPATPSAVLRGISARMRGERLDASTRGMLPQVPGGLSPNDPRSR